MKRNKTAAAVIRFIERHCRVPEGKKVGQPLELEPFQKKFIGDICRPAVRDAYLSIARKNGKTVLIAALVLAYICGPLVRRNSQIISGAMSRDQAGLVFDAAYKMIGLNPALLVRCHVVISSKTIKGVFTGVTYRAISADAQTAHGLSPVFAILDEIGQIRGPQSPFIEAIVTSQGAHDQPLLVAISTQAANDNDLFSIWLDRAAQRPSDSVVCHLYKADDDCDLMDRTQWKKANPGLGTIRNEADLAKLMSSALESPYEVRSRRNLCLNQRIEINDIWIELDVWKANRGKLDLSLFADNDNVHLGLDLSKTDDITAAVFATLDDNQRINLLPLSFVPQEGLKQRAIKDREPYSEWVDMGHLIAVPGAVVDYHYVVTYLKNFCLTHKIKIDTVQFDRWGMKTFEHYADGEQMAPSALYVEVGQGFKDFSPRCKWFIEQALRRNLVHGNHPLLNMAANNAVVVSDPADNIKLDKKRSTKRIDPLVAAIMAAYPLLDSGNNRIDLTPYMT